MKVLGFAVWLGSGGDELRARIFSFVLAVRLKTLGDGPFIESIGRLETQQRHTVTNFTGDKTVGQSWTDKLQVKAQASAQEPLPQDELEGLAYAWEDTDSICHRG